jgi:ubiquinone/menaquinone biosynthesis C-methylase UbiE
MTFLFRRRRAVVMVEPQADHRFRLFGGRRHLAALPYPLPKDMGEINRLDFQHYLLRAGAGGNFLAPVQQANDILDVGSGSGRWAMEVAAAFPMARVIGMDLVPPAVDEAAILGNGLDQRPPNYSFAPGNILEGLPFPDASFDFVHQRLLITAIPKDRWPSVIQELVRVTRPGGWVELAECGVPEDGGSGFMGLWSTWIKFLITRGVDFTIGHTIGQMLGNGGLTNVGQRVLDYPMGNWGGRIGRASATDCLAVGKALRAGVVAASICSEAQYDRLYALAESEFASRRGRGVLPFYIACGQRAI